MRHVFRYLVERAPTLGAVLTLGPEDSHHLARVVRRRAGETVELIGPDGARWPAVVRDPGPPATVVVAGGPRREPARAAVDLYLGLAEWGRLDWAVEKAAELGVRRVVLVVSARARRVPGPEAWARRRDRLERVAAAAARQSGATSPSRIEGLVPFAAVIGEIPPGQGFLLDPHAPAPLLGALLARGAGPADASVLVGPDTGWHPDEVGAGVAAGLAPVTLGPAVLRTEGAAVAACALALAAADHRREAPAAG